MITAKNVLEFIEGNVKYYNNLIFDTAPDYIKEQIEYRLSKCASDCLVNNKCKKCNCPPYKKAWVTESCNKDRFPDLKNKLDWEEFKLSKDYDKGKL